jgi:hypothetical protein
LSKCRIVKSKRNEIMFIHSLSSFISPLNITSVILTHQASGEQIHCLGLNLLNYRLQVLDFIANSKLENLRADKIPGMGDNYIRWSLDHR